MTKKNPKKKINKCDDADANNNDNNAEDDGDDDDNVGGGVQTIIKDLKKKKLYRGNVTVGEEIIVVSSDSEPDDEEHDDDDDDNTPSPSYSPAASPAPVSPAPVSPAPVSPAPPSPAPSVAEMNESFEIVDVENFSSSDEADEEEDEKVQNDDDDDLFTSINFDMSETSLNEYINQINDELSEPGAIQAEIDEFLKEQNVHQKRPRPKCRRIKHIDEDFQMIDMMGSNQEE